MNYTTTSTPFVKGLATLGMLLTAGAMTSFANINATRTLADVEMQAPTLKVSTEAVAVNGTGAVTFKFNFVVDNGCCMRVQAQLMRQIVAIPNRLGPPLPGIPSVVTQKTFELCGNLNDQSLTTTLDATSDNANFFVQFINPDSWDKAHVTMSNIKITFPIPIQILSVSPSTPITLQQGAVDDNRKFTVPAGTTGKLKISLSWTGTGRVQLVVTKPDGSNLPSQNSVAGQSSLTIDNIPVSASDDGDWHLTLTNISSTNVPANSIGISVLYTINE